MKKLSSILLILCLFFSLKSHTQGVVSFTLHNGLTVYVWEDTTSQEAFGMVTVRAGSINDPDQYTGLAHYLEHLMFKGTDRIGALDWEAERAVYQQIIEKYDQRAQETDPKFIQEIDLEINSLTADQSNLSKQGEFSVLVDNMGGTNLNAGTSYDFTAYFNTFPANQLEKWLDLYSVRLINPVFRGFQPELETVYEEYNMYQDDRDNQQRNLIFKHAFAGTPYSRSVLGEGEHLKNPKLSELISFYEQWYVPENMALILVGNFNAQEIAGLINRKFARLPAMELSETQEYTAERISGRTRITGSVGYTPQVRLVFEGVPAGHPDDIPLQIAAQMLSNRNRTGILDKLSLEGDVMEAFSYPISLKQGRFVVGAVPAYDYSQRRFESHRVVERMLLRSIEQLRKADVEEWLLESVKNSMARSNLRDTESNRGKAMQLHEAFVYGYDLNRVLDMPGVLHDITMDDVVRVANTYLNDNFMAFHLTAGEGSKKDHIDKPELPELQSVYTPENSVYAQWLEQLSVPEMDFTPGSFDDVTIKPINEKSQLFYYPNRVNDIFTMTLKYGVGSDEIPELDIAVDLMNTAGVMATFKPQEFRAALSQVNAIVNYSHDEDYVYVTVEGTEDHLELICNLISRQILTPDIDDKQRDNVKGQYVFNNEILKDIPYFQQMALREYIYYKDRSGFLDRLDRRDVYNLSTSALTASFQRATDYAADVHYVGSLPFEEVHSILSTNLPLRAMELESKSPQEKPKEEYPENKIFFLPNRDITQSRIICFVGGENYTPDKSPEIFVFNKYFGLGFGSVVVDEIREKRSMAYHAQAAFLEPQLEGNPFWFGGFVGTQSDKTVEAVEVFLDLINNMPENEARMEQLKSYACGFLATMKPNFRGVSQVYENWKRQGFTEPVPQYILPKIDEMTFDDIVSFYEENLKGRPVVIGIVANPREVDSRDFSRFGKVERIGISTIIK